MVPYEIKCLVLYKFGGLEHPTATIMKKSIQKHQSSYINHDFKVFMFNRFIFSKLDVKLKERFYNL